MASNQDELVFVPLGGLGEIGMNAALYGFGPEHERKWILVDCGMGFGGEENLPGIDLVYPDLSFIEEERKNLLGIFITHAHEDHIGALVEMWPRLRAPVYATRFAIGLLETRRLSELGAPKIDLKEIAPGRRVELGPFSVEYVPVAHSIPESNALAIRTPLGLVVHTGDWKLDPTPYLGSLTAEEEFRRLGDEGVLALVCDSTNVVRDGVSPSESDVARELANLIKDAPHRVAITTFASNVARMRSVADAARQCGREVVVVGRAMDRVVEVARECGFLEGVADFRPPETFGYLPRDKVVALLTGSQGEPRAALARIAADEHPEIALSKGDRVIFSSRPIPGNERAIGRVINGLVSQGVEVITDRTHLVHVSGHPRRAELEDMIGWVRPRTVIPVHGESLHLAEHAALARRLGARTLMIRNGDLVKLAPGDPEIIDEVQAGRLYKDGSLLIQAESRTVADRKRLSFSGVISVALAINDKGQLLADPEVEMIGIPDGTADGIPMDDIAYNAVVETFDTLPKARRRDPDSVAEAIRRGVRAAVAQHWRKKPNVTVHILIV